MVTRNHSPVGASNSNPSTATSATAGQEVTSPGTTIPVPGAETPLHNPVASPKGDPMAAASAFEASFRALQTAMEPYLRAADPGAKPGGHGVSSKRVAAILPLTGLLRANPLLAPEQQPDVLDAELAFAVKLREIAVNVHGLYIQLLETARLSTADSWRGASAVYVAANHKAKTNAVMEAKVAPIRALLALGKRVNTQASTASAASHKATAAQTRATHAHVRAQIATVSQSVGAQAHALRHPGPTAPVPVGTNQGPAVPTPADASAPAPASAPASNQGPAPVPASVYQGPAVNPQGPALGR